MKTRRRNALSLDYRFIVLFSDIAYIACEGEVMIPMVNDDKFAIPSQQEGIPNRPLLSSPKYLTTEPEAGAGSIPFFPAKPRR